MAEHFLIILLLFCSIYSLVQAGYSTKIRCGESAGNKWINLVQVRTPFECTYAIRPYSMFVCQLKVEFTTNMPQPLEPTSPSGIPVCPDDARIEIGRFTICGYNNKQHLHIRFDGSYLTNFETIRVNATSGTYKMKVTQITCPLPPEPEPSPQIEQQPQLPEVTQTVDSPVVSPTLAVESPQPSLPLPEATPASLAIAPPEPSSLLPEVTPAASLIVEISNSTALTAGILQGLPTELESTSSSPIEPSTQQPFITEPPAAETQNAVPLQTDSTLTEQFNPTEAIPISTAPELLTKEVQRFPHLLLKRSPRYRRRAYYPRRRTFDMLRFDTYILAPEGCDQYFSSPKGFVESLNWNYGRGPYPHSMQYTVCFKAPPRSVELFLTVLDFELGYNYEDYQVDDACNPTSPGDTTDYIQFDYPVNVQDTQLSATTFCGRVLQGRTLRVRNDGFASFTFNAGTNPGIAPVHRVFKFRYGYRYGGYTSS